MQILLAGPDADGATAAKSLDLITWAIVGAKCNAKYFIEADGFHHLALFLAKSTSTEQHSAESLLAQIRAADLVPTVCMISQWYTDAALEVIVALVTS